MKEIFLKLDKNATRTYLYAELLDRLSITERMQVLNCVEELEIPHEHHHDLAAVETLLNSLDVSERVKHDARSVYRILAEAEAQAHGCSVEETHFHEVGEGVSIENVVGICLAVEALNPGKISASPVQAGQGKVHCAHGILDIPAPATAAIFARGIPVTEEKLKGELCTPTSAALIYHFVDEYVW